MASTDKKALTLRAHRDIEVAYLGRGWSFPVRWHLGSDSRQGGLIEADELRLDRSIGQDVRVELVEGTVDIRQSIELILETMQGERVMHPDFGSEVHRYVFAAITVETMHNLGRAVRRALLRWERRIREIEVDVQENRTQVGRVDVHIQYTIDIHRMRQSLVYPFYVAHPENW